MLRRVDPRSKVIGISGKDRGAILPGGKTGTAYMYMAQTRPVRLEHVLHEGAPGVGRRLSMPRKPADRYFKAGVEAAAGRRRLRASRCPTTRSGTRKGGKLPKTMGEAADKPGPVFYSGLLRSPFADALTLDFARAAIAGEAARPRRRARHPVA